MLSDRAEPIGPMRMWSQSTGRPRIALCPTKMDSRRIRLFRRTTTGFEELLCIRIFTENEGSYRILRGFHAKSGDTAALLL